MFIHPAVKWTEPNPHLQPPHKDVPKKSAESRFLVFRWGVKSTDLHYTPNLYFFWLIYNNITWIQETTQHTHTYTHIKMDTTNAPNATSEAPKATTKSVADQATSRFADYFVICGLDQETGLEPDLFAGKFLLWR